MIPLETSALRLMVFFGCLSLLLLAEQLWPRRQRIFARFKRWRTNMGLVVLNSALLQLMGPVSAVAMAVLATNHGWGLLSLIPLPLWADLLFGFVLLDLAIYLQHWAIHRIPILWRVHRVHHCDRDLDATTALRFHPIEIVLSMIYKCGIVLILGPLALSVIIFEVVLNASAMFNHANVTIPKRLDGWLRRVIVTPDMHRVHHSVRPAETDSNYGFCLSWWDQLFGTYLREPKDGQLGMTIGLQEFQSNAPASLLWSLRLPVSGRD